LESLYQYFLWLIEIASQRSKSTKLYERKITRGVEVSLRYSENTTEIKIEIESEKTFLIRAKLEK